MKQGDGNKPIALVIFGVTGDLTRRKLIPALYQLCKDDQLPAPLHVIGFARRPWSDEKLREELTAGILQFARTKPVNAQSVEELLKNATYIPIRFSGTGGIQPAAGLPGRKRLSKGYFLFSHSARRLCRDYPKPIRLPALCGTKAVGAHSCGKTLRA